LSNKWIPMVALVFNNVKSNVLHWVNRWSLYYIVISYVLLIIIYSY
jgi:hypothetical protein